MSAQARHGANSYMPKRYPALILVPTGEVVIIDGKRWRCLRIERESSYGAHEQHRRRQIPHQPGKPGRPRKYEPALVTA